MNPYVLTFANHKGGVGKTSTAVNLAGLAAKGGWKTLFIDLDKQGSAGYDLGYIQDPTFTDDGSALAEMVKNQQPLRPVLRDVRPNLDVIPGGSALSGLDAWAGQQAFQGVTAAQLFAPLLEEVSREYHLIIMDTNPGVESLMQMALGAARYVVIPTKADQNSLGGFPQLAQKINLVKKQNPQLQILGAVLFDVDIRATKRRRNAQEDIAYLLDGLTEPFRTVIRSAQAVALDAREQGCLVHELKTSSALARDYQTLTKEILDRMSATDAGEQVTA